MLNRKDYLKIDGSQIKYKWLPIFICLFLCILVAGVWWIREKRERTSMNAMIAMESQKVLDIINYDMDHRIKSLRRIVNRWEMRGGTPKDEFVADAQANLIDDPGYQGLAWVDKNFYIRWIVPIVGNEPAQNLNLAFEKNRRIGLERAIARGLPSMTPPIDLVQGGKGFLIYFPIFIGDDFEGFILAVFRAQEWLDHLLHTGKIRGEEDNFLSLVSIDGIEVYKEDGWDNQKATCCLDIIKETTILYQKFTIWNRPTEYFVEHNHTALPELIVAVGLLLSFLISFTVYMFQKANKAMQITMAGKIALENEIKVRKQFEELLATESRRLSDILEGTNVGTWEWNVQTGETIFNERWANIIGYTLEEISPVSIETWMKFAHPDDLQKSDELLEKHFNRELDYYEFESRMRHKDGSWVWVLDRGKVATWTQDGKPLLMSGTHQDINERKRTEERIQHLATHDALTDLPSLRLAKDRILMAVNMARRNNISAAVMFVDLDGFKAVNDNYGHDAGDALLKEVAKRLLSSVRQTDTVARIGGDEFLVILTELHTRDDAVEVAEKLIKIVSQPFSLKGVEVTVGASIGIALYPDNGEDADSLIKQADDAMYVIKSSGKNSYTFAGSTKQTS